MVTGSPVTVLTMTPDFTPKNERGCFCTGNLFAREVMTDIYKI